MKLALLAFALVAAALPSSAELTRLEITSREPYGSFASGDYEIWRGRVHGELSPPEAIPGLDKSARNRRGRVEYSARIVLILPVEPQRGNGTLLVDVPNRGGAYAMTLYNSPRDEPFVSGAFEQGTGFLQDRGFSVAEVYWELGLGADLPTFVDEGGKKRYIEAAGFAIVRDTADFLAHGAADASGAPNPLKGAIKRTVASGKSQAGRFLRTFLLEGFNVAQGRRVFDGMHLFTSPLEIVPIMQTPEGPESSAGAFPLFDSPDMRGILEEPLTIGEFIERVRARGETPPRILMLNSVTDYYARRASLGRTGAAGVVDRPLPPNVRMYDMAGASHVIVPKAPASCPLAAGRLDWSPLGRATLLRLVDWIDKGTEPPGTRLMPLEPAPPDPQALRAPAHLPRAVMQVPKRDADGNSVGGVRLPDVEAPLGTYRGLNAPTRACMLVGGYVPFALTRTEREAAGDARLSVAERYRDRDDYVNRIRVAARNLMRDGFLLEDDAAVIVQSAASNPGFARIPRAASREILGWRPEHESNVRPAP